MTYTLRTTPIPLESSPVYRVALTAPAARPCPFDAEISAAQAKDQARVDRAANEREAAQKRGSLISGYYEIQDPGLRRAFLLRHRRELFDANR